MPRSPLPIGTWGKIRREQIGPRRHRARARFRDYDGLTRDVEAWGTSGAAAERALLIKLRDRSAPTNDEITGNTRINQLADLWLAELIAEDRLALQTIHRYETSVRTAIRPGLGNLRVREATTSRLDKFLKALADRPSAARGAKVVLEQMLAMAVRHGAMTTNPIRDVGRLPTRRRRRVKALQVDELNNVRAAIRRWQTPQPGKPGPRHSGDLADIVDLLLATGARIGEVLALRWNDLDLKALRPQLTFSGTLVYLKGRGIFRQPWTKSDAGYRTVFLPRFAIDMLLRRRIDAEPNPNDAIFATRKGTWLSPNNVRRQWREARKDTGLEWVTPHTFRKTVATLIDREADTKTAAEQLGHSKEDVTNTYYIDKAKIAPDMSEVLQALADGTSTTQEAA